METLLLSALALSTVFALLAVATTSERGRTASAARKKLTG